MSSLHAGHAWPSVSLAINACLHEIEVFSDLLDHIIYILLPVTLTQWIPKKHFPCAFNSIATEIQPFMS